MSKLIFLDLETTGLNPRSAAIIQLGAVIVEKGRILSEVNIRIRPHDGADVTERALEVNGIKVEDFAGGNYLDYREGKRQFVDVLDGCVNRFKKDDKLFLIGYNVHSFDAPFLRALFERCNDKYYGSWFWHPPIDLMLICAYLLRRVRHTMPDFKLGTVCRKMGVYVDEEQQHDALYDVKLCIELWRVIMEGEDA